MKTTIKLIKGLSVATEAHTEAKESQTIQTSVCTNQVKVLGGRVADIE